jgi:hypothetical protein
MPDDGCVSPKHAAETVSRIGGKSKNVAFGWCIAYLPL